MAKNVNYGEYAFLAGILIAFIVGVLANFVPAVLMPILVAVLFLLGIVVGLVNIQEKETNSFLIATIALLVAASSWNTLLTSTVTLLATSLGLSGEAGLGVAAMIVGFTSAIIAFVSPAAFIVALKLVYKLAQPE